MYPAVPSPAQRLQFSYRKTSSDKSAGGLLNESCRLVHALSGQGHVCDSTAGVEAKGYLVEAGTDGISNYE